MEVKETISRAPSYDLKITFMEKMQSRTRQGCFLNAIFHLQKGDFLKPDCRCGQQIHRAGGGSLNICWAELFVSHRSYIVSRKHAPLPSALVKAEHPSLIYRLHI